MLIPAPNFQSCALAPATTAATARVVVAVSSHTVNALKGRASYIRWSGARTERVDKRTCLCVLRKLCRECRVFSLQARYFLLGEEIKYRIRAVALTVDDVSRAGIDSVRNIASVLCHIVVHTVNSTRADKWRSVCRSAPATPPCLRR